METRLVNNFAQHQSARAIWDSLVVTYESGKDLFQIYDLEVRANKVNQGGQDLEDFWNKLHGIWVSIDQRQPNPFGCCEKGINQYRPLIDNRQLFQFFSGVRWSETRRSEDFFLTLSQGNVFHHEEGGRSTQDTEDYLQQSHRQQLIIELIGENQSGLPDLTRRTPIRDMKITVKAMPYLLLRSSKTARGKD